MVTRSMVAWLAGALALVSGCAAGAPATSGRVLPADAELTMRHGDGRVGTYVASPEGLSTASYWIEGPEGLVVIDAQLLLSSAEEMLDWAEAATKKKALLAIVLHPDPDKFNGTGVLRKRGVRVVTSKQVHDRIPPLHETIVKAARTRFGSDYPRGVPLPVSFGEASTNLTAAGLTVRAHVLGAGQSDAHVVVEWEGHVFTGDLVTNGTHASLAAGRVDAWLARLAEIERMKPRHVHPGRGPSGGAELLAVQRAYLESVIDAVAREKPSGKPSAEALERIRAAIAARWPGYGQRVLLEAGLAAEWERQARAGGAAAAGAH